MKYNIHCLLFDLTKGHFKSKWLCKHDKHNYLLQNEIDCVPIVTYEYAPDGRSLICKKFKYDIKWDMYYECNCCKDRVEIDGKR